jgi:hypothetical protein
MAGRAFTQGKTRWPLPSSNLGGHSRTPKWQKHLHDGQNLDGSFSLARSLQVSTAHRLVTSLEQFRAIVQIIESNDDLAKRVKRIRWQHGAEEIETLKDRGLSSKLVDQQLEDYQTRKHPHG